LQGDEEIFDLAENRTVTQYELLQFVREYRELIKFLWMMRVGTVVLTYQEYLILPATVMDAYEIYQGYLAKKKSGPGD